MWAEYDGVWVFNFLRVRRIWGGTKTTITKGSQARTLIYDALGRVTSESNPENGTTTYVYDVTTVSDICGAAGRMSPGDLVQKKDANGVTICYIYDSLHRMTDVGPSNYSSTNGCRRYRYDNSNGVTGTKPGGITITNSLGRMVEAETDACTPYPPTQASILTDEWSSYDSNGRLTDVYESTPHSGGYYHTTAQLFANGALQSLSGIPGYTALSYGIDGEGRLSTAQKGTFKIVCDPGCSSTSTTYDAGGRPLVVKIGGTTDNDTYTYYPNTGRMQTYNFNVGSASVAGTLTWNANGTLRTLAITDGFNSGGTQTCNYGTSSTMGYDDLGRLLSVNCGSPWAQTFSYDQYDNITKSGSISWACPSCYDATTNRYNSTLSSSISYDNNGNLLNDTFNKYSWDAYGHPSTIGSTTGSVTCGTTGTCLIYDALGRRVEKSVNNVYSEVLYSPVGKTAIMSGMTTSSAYFPLPARATYYASGSTGGNSYFWHKDWLGSVRFASTIGNRSSYYDRAFAPYGEMYNNFGNTGGVNFTGDTQDTISGTFDTPARELNPSQGRWISPDPAGAGWNLYAYSTNPNGNIDPTGTRDLEGSAGMWDPLWGGGQFGAGLLGAFFGAGALYVAPTVPANASSGVSGLSSGSEMDRILNGASAFAAIVTQANPLGLFLFQEEPLEEEKPPFENLEPENPLEPVDPEAERGPYAYDFMHPGPLEVRVAATFAGGRYSPVTVGGEGWGFDALYRVWGGASTLTGRDGTFYSPVPQVGGLQSAIDNAVNPNWGNGPTSNGLTMENVTCVYLAPGTQAYIGPIANQGGVWVGGGIQIYVPNVPNVRVP